MFYCLKVQFFLYKNKENLFSKITLRVYFKNLLKACMINNLFLKKYAFMFWSLFWKQDQTSRSNRFNHQPVAFSVRFTLLNRLSIGPIMNRLNQWLDRWPGGPGGSKRIERFKSPPFFCKHGRLHYIYIFGKNPSLGFVILRQRPHPL